MHNNIVRVVGLDEQLIANRQNVFVCLRRPSLRYSCTALQRRADVGKVIDGSMGSLSEGVMNSSLCEYMRV